MSPKDVLKLRWPPAVYANGGIISRDNRVAYTQRLYPSPIRVTHNYRNVRDRASASDYGFTCVGRQLHLHRSLLSPWSPQPTRSRTPSTLSSSPPFSSFSTASSSRLCRKHAPVQPTKATTTGHQKRTPSPLCSRGTMQQSCQSLTGGRATRSSLRSPGWAEER